jgi:hypothetical protein
MDMRKVAKKCIVLSLGLLLVYTSQTAYGQEGGTYPSRNRGAQYFLGSEDELLVPVNIWGFVNRPGQYMVHANTDLISLLSFAGGPTESAKISRIEIVRSDLKEGNRIYKVNVKKFLATADGRLIPTLKPGDTVIVKGTTFHWISKFFEFTSKLVVFAQFFYFIAIASEYLKD